jgi:hypothetical protein
MDKRTVLDLDDREEKISICDIMKEDTSEIIQKLESHMPVMFQNYSDLYRTYLHMYDDLFGTCYMAEKEFFDKLNIDQGVLKQFKELSKSVKSYYLDNVEMSTKLFDEYVKIRITAVKSFDNYAHVMMEFYAKVLSEFNKSTKSSE